MRLVIDLSIFVRNASADDAAVLLTHRELSRQEATQYRGSVPKSTTDGLLGFTLVAEVVETPVVVEVVVTPAVEAVEVAVADAPVASESESVSEQAQ